MRMISATGTSLGSYPFVWFGHRGRPRKRDGVLPRLIFVRFGHRGLPWKRDGVLPRLIFVRFGHRGLP